MKKIRILIFFGLILATLAFRKTTENSFPLFGKFIILDPGHGGKDPGCVYKDEYEKDYNLDFAFSLKNVLEQNGATVLMTREGDYDLSSPNNTHRKKSDFDNRIKLIEESQADIYISLHMNYLNDSSYYGSQVFYDDNNSQNKSIALLLQKNLNTFFNFEKNAKQLSNDKYMFQRINTKGILIEYGFISSARDRKNLKNEDYRASLSQVISDSIIKYFT